MKINQILIIQGFNQNCIVAHFGHTRAKYVFLNLPSKTKSLALFLLVKKYICSLVTKYICSCLLKQENVLVVKGKIKSLFLQKKCFSVLNFFDWKNNYRKFFTCRNKAGDIFAQENKTYFLLMGKQHILQNASENAPITKNGAIGILVTALSPDCQHFDLNIRIYVNKCQHLSVMTMYHVELLGKYMKAFFV